MKGDAQSFAAAMERHKPTAPTTAPPNSAEPGADAAEQEDDIVEAAAQLSMQHGFTFHKLLETKEVLRNQGAPITVDSMWEVLENDCTLHGRQMPPRARAPDVAAE
jgi:hypothetical protein